MPAPLQSVTVLAPAKLNLSLDVVGLLPGGYHARSVNYMVKGVCSRCAKRPR